VLILYFNVLPSLLTVCEKPEEIKNSAAAPMVHQVCIVVGDIVACYCRWCSRWMAPTNSICLLFRKYYWIR
jgi:hypothetical protein